MNEKDCEYSSLIYDMISEKFRVKMSIQNSYSSPICVFLILSSYKPNIPITYLLLIARCLSTMVIVCWENMPEKDLLYYFEDRGTTAVLKLTALRGLTSADLSLWKQQLPAYRTIAISPFSFLILTSKSPEDLTVLKVFIGILADTHYYSWFK